MTEAARAPSRIESVDALRGIVMTLMALDHTRDFFGDVHFDPTALSRTTPALFVTRWVTHFCAPIFMLLAGTSAYLWRSARGRTAGELSVFLATRGAWLVALEVLFIRPAWWPAIVPHVVPLQVIWALGASMIALALIVRLPVRWVLVVGLTMILCHDLFDGLQAERLGGLEPLWLLLHQPGAIEAGPVTIYVAYPLVPWIGVMAAGYALGSVLQRERDARRKALIALGTVVTGVFVALRAVDRYGDPHAWSVQGSALFTLLSFVNVAKYPPSLDYVAMTVGPALLALAALDRPLGPVLQRVQLFGKVPLFYYVCHLYLLRGGAILLDAALHGSPRAELFGAVFSFPDGYGYSLPVVYSIWVLALAILYLPSRWFSGVKARHKGAFWVSYV